VQIIAVNLNPEILFHQSESRIPGGLLATSTSGVVSKVHITYSTQLGSSNILEGLLDMILTVNEILLTLVGHHLIDIDTDVAKDYTALLA
jgi:hypothetical protein